MEVLRSISPSPIPFQAQCTDQQCQPVQSKLALYYPDCSKRLPIFCTLNSSSSVKCSSNTLQKCKDDTHNFWSSKPAIDVSLASSKIKEYTDKGLFQDAIMLYLNMLEHGFLAEEFQFFPCLIKAFGALGDTNKGMEVHGHLLKLGVLEDIYIANSLLSMYWKCGAVKHATKMFEKMENRDVVSWNAIVSGFCQSGDYENSLTFFCKMTKEFGCAYLSRVAFLSALSSIASLMSLPYGKQIHSCLVKSCLDSDEFLVSGLLDMYIKCGDIKSAEKLFSRALDEESVRGNKVLWNVMILGYVSNECQSLAVELLVRMLKEGINPDSSTLVAALLLCTKLVDLEVGKQVHGMILRYGLDNDVRVRTALIEMYFKCGDPDVGLKLFRQSENYNLVMWGSVLSNCAQHGFSTEVMGLFREFMLDYSFPDSVILLAALRACASLMLKPMGMEIHGLAIKLGCDSGIFVGGALVDLYAKCGDMESAEIIFSKLQSRDLISWNALIAGFSQNGQPDKALEAFRDMQSEQIKPNTVTIAYLLSICSYISAMTLCKEIHGYILRHRFDSNVLVNNSLIGAYAKCGYLNSSWTIFRDMPERNEVSWNSIISGFGMHGQTDKMSATFEEMKKLGVKPSHTTFTAILSACSHAGKVQMGWKYFNSMIKELDLEPWVDHYTCMVDLLGRAGHLNDAYNLIMAMPCAPDDRIWGSLLGSCKTFGNSELADTVAKHLFELDPENVGYRVLLANLYEDLGKPDEVARVRSEIEGIGVGKQPGCSWIEVNNSIHVFMAGSLLHGQSDKIYATIESLKLEMNRLGYVPRFHSASVGLDDTVNGRG